ncbi:MAG: alpha-glucosidase/alpha-galactosidase, partial [Halanaerobiales bacterium]
ELPPQIRNLVLPHVINQNLIVEASLEGNIEKAFSALYNDPLCSHLDYADIKQMGNDLIAANKEFLTQFKL